MVFFILFRHRWKILLRCPRYAAAAVVYLLKPKLYESGLVDGANHDRAVDSLIHSQKQ
jgi:hypothetical protein